MDILVTYDVETKSDGGLRLRRVAQVCEKYGVRVQFSVLECRLSPTRLARMVGEVQDVMDPRLDSLIVYRFNGRIEDARSQFGRRGSHELGQPWVI